MVHSFQYKDVKIAELSRKEIRNDLTFVLLKALIPTCETFRNEMHVAGLITLFDNVRAGSVPPAPGRQLVQKSDVGVRQGAECLKPLSQCAGHGLALSERSTRTQERFRGRAKRPVSTYLRLPWFANDIHARRGAGKTALLIEAKKEVEAQGAVVFWTNAHMMRHFTALQAFLAVVNRICDLPLTVHGHRAARAPSFVDAQSLSKITTNLLQNNEESAQSYLIIPQVQAMLTKLTIEKQGDLFIFLDDFHYLKVEEQPVFLDLIHSVTRDLPIWIKAACIKHQSRWFTDNPPTGLQVGHDAAVIDLDITLEDPAKARKFLTNILDGFIQEAKLPSLSSAISPSAADRLVLASGGVPRDFLVLSALAIETARQRANARSTGVQDVNEAAGKFSQAKLRELEDDAASAIGQAKVRRDVLQRVRSFLLDDRATTFFRIDFLDKELHNEEYTILQSLMDLRLLHLINSSISDESQAGRRFEVYMLDLSQFSGSRLRKNLRVLDLVRDFLVLKSTGVNEPAKVGDTSRKLLALLRRGPAYDLQSLSNLVVHG